MDREQKTAVVDELATELKDSSAIFAVDYRGISVPQAAELRATLRDADTRFRVVKNRLTLRAADEAGTDGLKNFLSGPTALALVKGDAALAAKTLDRLGSEDVKLFRPRPHPDRAHDAAPGTVLAAEPEDATTGILDACGTGAVCIREVKPAGKRRMTAAEWVRGRGIGVGDRLL
jgi:ribosomal protein L10